MDTCFPSVVVRTWVHEQGSANPGSNARASDINSHKDVEMADKSASVGGRQCTTLVAPVASSVQGATWCQCRQQWCPAYLVVPVALELQAVKPGSSPPLRELGWRDCSCRKGNGFCCCTVKSSGKINRPQINLYSRLPCMKRVEGIEDFYLQPFISR